MTIAMHPFVAPYVMLGWREIAILFTTPLIQCLFSAHLRKRAELYENKFCFTSAESYMSVRGEALLESVSFSYPLCQDSCKAHGTSCQLRRFAQPAKNQA
uniref:Uncharacterized protein n=1 Tax=Candidatus Kentrum sp. TC TaxID=2126339 RepID=A0A450YUG0_9GAMM|nr:MAG: hypothetical protein BECKTC1821E_GA0114239_10445 [Candidatus Kentron sp. TC]